LPKGKVQPSHSQLSIEYDIVSLTAYEAQTEPVPAQTAAKRMFRLPNKLGDLSIGTSKECGPSTSSCAFEIEEHSGRLCNRMLRESNSTVEEVFLAIVQQKDDVSLGSM
jgi:hypothetical protein